MALVGRKVVTHLPNGDEVVFFENEGHLLCQRCGGGRGFGWRANTKFCKHIKFLYVNNQDSPSLWEDLERTDHYSNAPLEIMVPVSADANQWAKTHLRLHAGYAEVGVVCPDTGFRPDTGSEERLGILWPGEGRNVIRMMVHNWFIPKLVDLEKAVMIDLACEASSHGPAAEAEVTRNLSSDSTRLGEQWSLYWNRRCLACEKKLQEISDLIPEK